MPTISSGQITLIDLHDAPSLSAWISTSQTTVQTYNNTTQTWTPSYTSSPQVLTLNLTKAGSPASILANVDVNGIKWFKRVGTTTTEITSILDTATEYKGGTKSSVLTTKVNTPTANNAVIWTAEGTWIDPVTELPVDFSAEIKIELLQLAKAAVIGNIYAPDGDFFRNNTPASLKINADLYKDGALSAGSKKIKWFAQDSSVTTSQDADGGVGWRKITATTGTTGDVANVGFDVATTGQGVLTVYPNAVTNAQTYLAVITDNAGGTSGTKVKNYVTLKDMDDPVMVVVEALGGNILKNGAGSTTLTARLYRNGEEIDLGGTIHTYTWTKWQDGASAAFYGGGSTKTGKTLAVGSNDVNVKTTFMVEVS